METHQTTNAMGICSKNNQTYNNWNKAEEIWTDAIA
jgi:hypothetical protein